MKLNSKAQASVEVFNRLRQMPNEMVIAIQQRMKETQEGVPKPTLEKVKEVLESREYSKNEFLNITFDIASETEEELVTISSYNSVKSKLLRLYIDLLNIERKIIVKGETIVVK